MISKAAIRARRLLFEERGMSIAEWAREEGFNPNLVYMVLRGSRRALRGQSHSIAVKLGLKRGMVLAGPKKRAV